MVRDGMGFKLAKKTLNNQQTVVKQLCHITMLSAVDLILNKNAQQTCIAESSLISFCEFGPGTAVLTLGASGSWG